MFLYCQNTEVKFGTKSLLQRVFCKLLSVELEYIMSVLNPCTAMKSVLRLVVEKGGGELCGIKFVDPSIRHVPVSSTSILPTFTVRYLCAPDR
jgi:hypothetical protein